MMIKRFYSVLFASALLMFGYPAFAVGTLDKHQVASYLVSDAGSYGVALARYEASNAYMVASGVGCGISTSGLLRDSHGFRQASADDFEGFAAHGNDQLSMT